MHGCQWVAQELHIYFFVVGGQGGTSGAIQSSFPLSPLDLNWFDFDMMWHDWIGYGMIWHDSTCLYMISHGLVCKPRVDQNIREHWPLQRPEYFDYDLCWLKYFCICHNKSIWVGRDILWWVCFSCWPVLFLMVCLVIRQAVILCLGGWVGIYKAVPEASYLRSNILCSLSLNGSSHMM